MSVEKKSLSLDELVLCGIFWAGLNSVQFNKLEDKGQIIKMYNQEPEKSFTNFLDFDYLVEKTKNVKKGEYVLKIPKELKKDTYIKELINSGKATLVDEISLEDMFCTFLTDMDKKVASKLLEHFLNTNYYGNNKSVTNRLSHSLQVMFASGLTCKAVNATFEDTFNCMISSLFHDIGHVPFAHVMEQTIKIFAGHFSHETNGKRVIKKIVKEKQEDIIGKITQYLPETIEQEKIQEKIEEKTEQIGRAIIEHSRTNSERRGNGLIVQVPRGSDKIAYSITDLNDLLNKIPKKLIGDNSLIDFLPDEDKFSKDSKAFTDFCKALKQENYGRAFAIAASSVIPILMKGKEVYNVNEDIWQYIKALIENETSIRKKSGIEKNEKKIEVLALVILAKITAEEYDKNNKDLRTAFEATIDEITCMGEKDLYNYCNNITIASKEQLNYDYAQGIPRTIAEQLKDGIEPINEAQIKGMRTSIQEARNVNGNLSVDIENGTKTNKSRLIQPSNTLSNALVNMTDGEAVEIFKKLFVVSKQQMDLLSNIKKTEDIQLKIVPTGRTDNDVFGLRVLNSLGITEGEEDDITEKQKVSVDYYEPINPKGSILVNLSHIEGTSEQTLTVKERVPKKKKQVWNIKYETTGENGLSVSEMVEKLNSENPGLGISLNLEKPKVHLDIDRMFYTRIFEREELVITEDIAKDENGIEYPILEIHSPQNTKILDKIKKILELRLGKKVKFTQLGKYERAILGGNKKTTGEERD